MLTSLFAFGLIGTLTVESKDCKYVVSGISLDLSPLQGETLLINDSKWTYEYTPCEDGLECSSGSLPFIVMADQIKTEDDTCTSYLAYWNKTTQPKYSDGIFTFTYANGESSETCPQLRANL